VGIAAWIALGRSLSHAPAFDSLVGPDLARVTQGRALYAANCASCHGAKGEGEPNWKSSRPDGTYPAPPHDATGHTWHHSDKLLYEIIRDGGARYESATFRSRMPAWGDRLSDAEIRAVLVYLKTLWGTEERRLQAEASTSDPLPSAVR
jgi:mono/diheme cytochrome c family protein